MYIVHTLYVYSAGPTFRLPDRLPKEDPNENRDGGEEDGVDVANPFCLAIFPDGAGSSDGLYEGARLRLAHSLHLRDAANPEQRTLPTRKTVVRGGGVDGRGAPQRRPSNVHFLHESGGGKGGREKKKIREVKEGKR